MNEKVYYALVTMSKINKEEPKLEKYIFIETNEKRTHTYQNILIIKFVRCTKLNIYMKTKCRKLKKNDL